MTRSFFFALGLFTSLVGGELFLVDRAVLNLREGATSNGRRWSMARGSAAAKQRVLNPPDWLAWALTSAGAVTMLYSLALPKKAADGK